MACCRCVILLGRKTAAVEGGMCLQDLIVMRFHELEQQGMLGGKVGDVEVAGIKQHKLMEWYFAHQAER